MMYKQYGSRKHKSTLLATFTHIKSNINHFNYKMSTSPLFLNLSKAFDFVDYPLLSLLLFFNWTNMVYLSLE